MMSKARLLDRLVVNEFESVLELTAASNHTYSVEVTEDFAFGWWRLTDAVPRETNGVMTVRALNPPPFSIFRTYRLVAPRQP